MTEPIRSKIEKAKRMRLVEPRPEEKGKVVVTFLPKRGGRREANERDERRDR